MQLVPLIKNIEFFKERGIEGDHLLDLATSMQHKKVLKDEFVFEYADIG